MDFTFLDMDDKNEPKRLDEYKVIAEDNDVDAWIPGFRIALPQEPPSLCGRKPVP